MVPVTSLCVFSIRGLTFMLSLFYEDQHASEEQTNKQTNKQNHLATADVAAAAAANDDCTTASTTTTTVAHVTHLVSTFR